jgi:hypothetical protein
MDGEFIRPSPSRTACFLGEFGRLLSVSQTFNPGIAFQAPLASSTVFD